LTLASGCTSNDLPLGSTADAKSSASPAVSPAVLERGKAIYKANCISCHGESGKGDGPGAGILKPPPRDHTDHAYMSTLSDKEIGDVIQMGGAMKGRPLMPSHPQIRDNDLKALVAFVRSLSEPAVSGAR
jgi:mono/diheme cytochrome c family protein